MSDTSTNNIIDTNTNSYGDGNSDAVDAVDTVEMNLSNISDAFEQVPSTNRFTETFKRKKKKVPLLHKSLAAFLLSLQGERITIELKNNSEIHGQLVNVSHGMDVTLSQVRIVDGNGSVTTSDELAVIGKSIRYCFVPRHIESGARHLNGFISRLESTHMYKSTPMIFDRKILKRKVES